MSRAKSATEIIPGIQSPILVNRYKITNKYKHNNDLWIYFLSLSEHISEAVNLRNKKTSCDLERYEHRTYI